MSGDRVYPCDFEPFDCPYNAYGISDCEYHCGLGVPHEPYPWEDYDVDADYNLNYVVEVDDAILYGPI